MLIKVKCKKCGSEFEMDISPIPSTLKPGKKIKGIKGSFSQEDIDKILNACDGQIGGNDLSKIGIEISKDELLSAYDRRTIRVFLEKNIRLSKDLRRASGENVKMGVAPWRYADKLRDINFTASELAAYGDDSLRMLPHITMKRNTHIQVEGQEHEILKGVKFLTFLDVSGSMFGNPPVKIAKALAMGEETYRLCRKLGFSYRLALFSDYGKNIPTHEIERFFTDSEFRKRYRMSGGTQLMKGLVVYDDEDYTDSNLLIISDMEIGDIGSFRGRIKEISQLTNSFRIILIKRQSRARTVDKIRSWFPDGKVEILEFKV